MDRARVRAKGKAEQAALDFSRLTRAPGPGTYPLQVHTSYSYHKLVPYALEGEASQVRTSYGSAALQGMHTPMHVGNVMANFQ